MLNNLEEGLMNYLKIFVKIKYDFLDVTDLR